MNPIKYSFKEAEVFLRKGHSLAYGPYVEETIIPTNQELEPTQYIHYSSNGLFSKIKKLYDKLQQNPEITYFQLLNEINRTIP